MRSLLLCAHTALVMSLVSATAAPEESFSRPSENLATIVKRNLMIIEIDLHSTYN